MFSGKNKQQRNNKSYLNHHTAGYLKSFHLTSVHLKTQILPLPYQYFLSPVSTSATPTTPAVSVALGPQQAHPTLTVATTLEDEHHIEV